MAGGLGLCLIMVSGFLREIDDRDIYRYTLPFTKEWAMRLRILVGIYLTH